MIEYRTCTKCSQEKHLTEFKTSKYFCHACYKQYHREYTRQYRVSNRKEENKRSRELYQINKSSITARKRQNYQNNRQKNIQRKLEWQKQNPELCRLSSARRRAQSIANGVFQVTSKDISRILSKPCFYCGTRAEPLALDHVVPISKGGRHSIGNLVSACKSCNSSKNDKYLAEWLKIKAKRFITVW